MMKRVRAMGNQRGIALLLVLSVTTILIAAALEYNRRARFAVLSTALARDRMTLAQMTTSGIHIAMALLAKDRADSNTDSLQEDWANSDKINQLLSEIPFDNGTLSITIADEMSRIQVNALVTYPDSRNFNESQRQLMERLLNFLNDDNEETQEDSQPQAIINSLKDWLDFGDDEATTGLSGAESDYYQGLSPAYTSRNAPMLDLNELLLVKGVTPKLFYGDSEKPGLAESLTVHGMIPGAGTSFNFPGKININTAGVPVLVALMPSENPELAQILFEWRQGASEDKDTHDFSNPTWYKSIGGLSGVNLNQNLITTASDVFRIVSKATVNSQTLAATVVVRRVQDAESGKWTCEILSWQTS